MAKIKLTKTAVEAAQPQAQAVELRDTVVPGFLCKITPAGRRVFMLQYRTNAGERRKPALGLFGELTVEQARVMAQDWLAEVRRGGDPGGAKTEARKAPTIAELCKKFMEDYSRKRNKPSTQEGYQGVITRCIIPLLGRKKVQDVKRPDVVGVMENSRTSRPRRTRSSASCARCSTWPRCGATGPMVPIPAGMCRLIRQANPPTSSAMRTWASCSGSSTRSKPRI